MNKSVAIIGTGAVGCDLLAKVLKSEKLACHGFIGRRGNSPGIAWARDKGAPVFWHGLQPGMMGMADIWFDCTDAETHERINMPFLEDQGAVINLTPGGKEGYVSVVPAVNFQHVGGFYKNNYKLITCGAQASIPLIKAFFDHQLSNSEFLSEDTYVEVASSISSDSAGPATRSNISEYIDATEEAVRMFSGVRRAKSILILNPADPPVKMQTTISICPFEEELSMSLGNALAKAVYKVQDYCPGYHWGFTPRVEQVRHLGAIVERLVMSVRVNGAGDYLPEYAGNLDIITSAAIRVAEELSGQNP